MSHLYRLTIALVFLFLASVTAFAQEGTASWYGHESGSVTANGERFNPDGITAASWHYPFNTRLRITVLSSGRSIIVRVNDRGPHKRLKRLIDLSRGAARALGVVNQGLFRVRVERL